MQEAEAAAERAVAGLEPHGSVGGVDTSDDEDDSDEEKQESDGKARHTTGGSNESQTAESGGSINGNGQENTSLGKQRKRPKIVEL